LEEGNGYFREKIEAGKAAGDVSISYDVNGNQEVSSTGNTAGVDCVGFINNVWRLSTRVGTSKTNQKTLPIQLVSLKRGDILIKYGKYEQPGKTKDEDDTGNHVVLFEEFCSNEPGSPCFDANDPDATEIPQGTTHSTEPKEFTIVRLHPNEGDLQAMLSTEAQKAIALGQMPVVEFDATWCPPCRAIDAAINSGSELMMDAYSGTYIVKLDVDEWGWNGDGVQNFIFEFIPVYFKLDSKGNQTGEVIDGGAWGEDVPENIAPVMDKFFHGE